MKTTFLILFFSLSAMASNWVPVSKIAPGSKVGYQLESECKKTGEQCLDVGSDPSVVSAGFVSTEDDWSGKSEIELCQGQSDCQTKLAAKTCLEGEKFIDQDYSMVYCTSLIGKKLVVDSVGFSAYKAQLAAAAQTEQLIAMGAKAEADCKRVLHLVGGLNLLPGRTQSQIDQMSTALEPIKQALQDGRPGKAKALIVAMEPDGVVVTAQMKALVLDILKDW